MRCKILGLCACTFRKGWVSSNMSPLISATWLPSFVCACTAFYPSCWPVRKISKCSISHSVHPLLGWICLTLSYLNQGVQKSSSLSWSMDLSVVFQLCHFIPVLLETCLCCPRNRHTTCVSLLCPVIFIPS